ncbi:MAG TPA: hypothetical protein VFT00_01650 [Nocardioides sp.]|nr:hypothetical protein [Nocardioides sp.]
MSQIGEELARALAGKDAPAVRRLLADDVDFKALTPGRFWEAGSVDEVVEVFFGSWFEPSDEIRALLDVRTGEVGDRQSVTYRLQVHNDDGGHEVEQQAYFSTVDGRVSFLRVLCSGYMPV